MAAGCGLALHPICQLKCSCQQMQMAACLLTFCPVMVSQLLFFFTQVCSGRAIITLGAIADGSTDLLKDCREVAELVSVTWLGPIDQISLSTSRLGSPQNRTESRPILKVG